MSTLDFDEYDEEELEELAVEDNTAALLEEFDQKVTKRINFLASPKTKNRPEQRARVAAWLGESGAPNAIKVLRHIYDTEKDNPSLRKAAEYALGQFKALDRAIRRDVDESIEEALARDENAHVRELLMSIALTGKTGKRKIIPLPVFILTNVVLALVLVVLVVLNIMALGGEEEEQVALPTQMIGTSPEHDAVLRALDDLQWIVAQNRDKAERLQIQFGNVLTVLTANTLDCGTRFLLQEDYELPEQAAATYPDLVSLAAQVDAASEQVNEAIAEHNDACQTRDGQTSYDRAGEIAPMLAALVQELQPLEETLATTRATLVDATIGPGGELVVTTPEATEPPTPTPSPTPEPTATLNPRVIDTHIRALTYRIDTVSDRQFGALGMLTQYWEDIRTAGQTGGCDTAPIEVPDDYTLIEPEVLATLPDLAEAMNNVNLALSLTRDSQAMFYSGCQEGNVAEPETLAIGTQQVQTAELALAAARELLGSLVVEEPVEEETPSQ